MTATLPTKRRTRTTPEVNEWYFLHLPPPEWGPCYRYEFFREFWWMEGVVTQWRKKYPDLAKAYDDADNRLHRHPGHGNRTVYSLRPNAFDRFKPRDRIDLIDLVCLFPEFPQQPYSSVPQKLRIQRLGMAQWVLAKSDDALEEITPRYGDELLGVFAKRSPERLSGLPSERTMATLHERLNRAFPSNARTSRSSVHTFRIDWRHPNGLMADAFRRWLTEERPRRRRPHFHPGGQHPFRKELNSLSAYRLLRKYELPSKESLALLNEQAMATPPSGLIVDRKDPGLGPSHHLYKVLPTTIESLEQACYRFQRRLRSIEAAG